MQQRRPWAAHVPCAAVQARAAVGAISRQQVAVAQARAAKEAGAGRVCATWEGSRGYVEGKRGVHPKTMIMSCMWSAELQHCHTFLPEQYVMTVRPALPHISVRQAFRACNCRALCKQAAWQGMGER